MKPTKVNSKADSNVDGTRRRFLFAAGCAPAIGVAVVLGGETVAEPAPQQAAAPSTEPGVSGYHVTDHIRKYYRIAGRF